MSSDGLVVDKALVVTHPHEKFDHGVVGEDFVGYAEQFEGDTYVVPFDGIRQCERPYGDASSYDNILNEVGSGKLHKMTPNFLQRTMGSWCWREAMLENVYQTHIVLCQVKILNWKLSLL